MIYFHEAEGHSNDDDEHGPPLIATNDGQCRKIKMSLQFASVSIAFP